jgi:hypothetical protein
MTRILTCALAIAAVCFIGNQSSAQPQGGPNVTVVNTPLPVTVTNPQGLVVGTPVAFGLGAFPATSNTYNVPSTQRLVMEYVSAGCVTPSNTQPPAFNLVAVTNGATIMHILATPFGTSNNWGYGQLVKIYADPGTQVVLNVNSGVCVVDVSGQLVTP